MVYICPKCNGKGVLSDKICDKCNGDCYIDISNPIKTPTYPGITSHKLTIVFPEKH